MFHLNSRLNLYFSFLTDILSVIYDKSISYMIIVYIIYLYDYLVTFNIQIFTSNQLTFHLNFWNGVEICNNQRRRLQHIGQETDALFSVKSQNKISILVYFTNATNVNLNSIY